MASALWAVAAESVVQTAAAASLLVAGRSRDIAALTGRITPVHWRFSIPGLLAAAWGASTAVTLFATAAVASMRVAC